MKQLSKSAVTFIELALEDVKDIWAVGLAHESTHDNLRCALFDLGYACKELGIELPPDLAHYAAPVITED